MAGSECAALFDWVRAAGGTVGRVHLKTEPGLGRGVYASEDLPKGEVLFSLPDRLIITTERALASSLGQYLAARCKIVKSCAEEQTVIEAADVTEDNGEQAAAAAAASAPAAGGGATGAADGADARPELTERSVLYAYLLQARHCAAATIDLASDEIDCGEYARALPTSFSTPFSWRQELGLLPAPLDDLDHDGVDLVSELGNLGQHLQEQFAVLKEALADGNHALQQGATGGLKVSQWLWAHQAYSSRCFPRSCLSSSAIAAGSDETSASTELVAGAGEGGGGGGGAEDGVMVPLLDMFNSVEDPSAANWTSNVSWELVRREEEKSEHGGVTSTRGVGEAVLNCDVGRGDQIFSSFGPKGNRTLLGCYGYCRWGNPFERVAIWVSALRLLSRDEDAAEENMAILQRFQEFAASAATASVEGDSGGSAAGESGGGGAAAEMCAGLRFDLTVEEPLPERMIGAARICCGGDEEMALAYLRELVVESSLQVLGEDSVESLEEQASAWRSKDDGSTVHIEVSTAVATTAAAVDGGGSEPQQSGQEQEAVQVKSYACSPEACALCFRHSQLAVLRAVDAALAQRMEEQPAQTAAAKKRRMA